MFNEHLHLDGTRLISSCRIRWIHGFCESDTSMVPTTKEALWLGAWSAAESKEPLIFISWKFISWYPFETRRSERFADKMNARNSSIDLDHLPPTYQLLMQEIEAGNPDEILQRLKRLWSELQRQADWTATNFEYVNVRTGTDSSQCSVSLLAGLDPFTNNAKCANPPCRILTAQHIGRSIGLYADRALAYDRLSTSILLTEEWSEEELLALANDAMVLAVLRPLLEAGIFQFLSPFYAACQACSDAWHTRIENLAKSIFEEIRSDLNAKLVGESIEIRTEGFFGTPMIQLRKLLPDEQHALKSGTKLESIVQKVMESELCGQIGSTLHALRDASSLGAITFSDSRVSLMAARDMDGLRPPYTEIENWEASRSATLPWIGDLSMEQVVILREEADSALPRFRERLQTLMTAPQKDTKIDSAAIASELRAEAAEVEAELGALNMKGRNRARNARGILGLTVAVYGFAGEFMDPALALTGLSVLLHQLHESHSKDAQQENLLHSQPAYVLAKAKELTQHAEGDS